VSRSDPAATFCSAARTNPARLADSGERSSVPRETRALVANRTPATTHTIGTNHRHRDPDDPERDAGTAAFSLAATSGTRTPNSLP
jgi:hypothetical protein